MVRIRAALNHSWDERQSPWIPLPLGAEQSFASPPRTHSSQDLLFLHCLKNRIRTGKGSPALLNRHEPQPLESAETPQLPELCTNCRKQPSLLQNSAHPLPFAKGDSLEYLCFSKRLFPWKHHTRGRTRYAHPYCLGSAAAALISLGLQEWLAVSVSAPSLPITEIYE